MIDSTILEVFYTQFVTYYKSHQAHWNSEGRNFYSDHKLLGKIYSFLYETVDDLAEIIRTLDIELPQRLTEIIEGSRVEDTVIDDDGDNDERLEAIYEDLKTLVGCYRELEAETNDIEYSQINNFAQDQVRQLEKFSWMLRSTLSQDFKNPPY
jgi:starvation-inducible DNA-binding protein